MKLSTKGRYAVTAMMDLAIHDRDGPVTLADISNCQGISLSYLEQLFSKLRQSGLVEGVRGPGVVIDCQKQRIKSVLQILLSRLMNHLIIHVAREIRTAIKERVVLHITYGMT